MALRFPYPAFALLIVHLIAIPFLGAAQGPSPGPEAILSEIEQGILHNDAAAFADHLGPQVAIAMSNDWGGSYSTNQSYSILKNFLGVRKTIGFRFTTIQQSGPTAYATGGGSFVRRGTKENLQIYVRLTLIEKRWLITQINMY